MGFSSEPGNFSSEPRKFSSEPGKFSSEPRKFQDTCVQVEDASSQFLQLSLFMVNSHLSQICSSDLVFDFCDIFTAKRFYSEYSSHICCDPKVIPLQVYLFEPR